MGEYILKSSTGQLIKHVSSGRILTGTKWIYQEDGYIPSMSADDDPSPFVASSSGTEDAGGGNGPTWKAFDGLDTTYWQSNEWTGPNQQNWIKIDVGTSIMIWKLKFISYIKGYDTWGRAKVTLLDGSNNQLMDWYNIPNLFTKTTYEFEIAGKPSSRYWKLVFQERSGVSSISTFIYTFQIYRVY